MFNLFPRRNPTLPQDDSKLEQFKRKIQLKFTQEHYEWDTENPNVGPVPIVKKLPKEALPTLTWAVKVAEVLIPVVENLIANVKDATELIDIKDGFREISDAIEHINPGQQLALITNSSLMLKSLINMFQRLVQQEVREHRDEAGLQAYKDLFKKLPLPAVAEVFQQNDCFARFRVAGQNPMLIKGITAIPANFPVTEQGYQNVMGSDDSLDQAIADKRLYLLDYHELEQLSEHSQRPDKKVFAPMALFAIPKGKQSLTPVAIQDGQDPTSSAIFYAVEDNSGTPEYWQWQAAMTMVQVADGNYHELFVHLARTHLVIEAFTISTNRCLAETHPVNILLLPHFEGTLFINNSAANSLIAPDGPIDNIFGGKIQATQQAAGTDRLNIDFYQYMLPNDLASRNVDNKDYLPDYPYRDDAILVWDAIRNWTQSYIEIYYKADDDIVNDYELTAWTESLMTEGAISGFKPITTREQLANVLTMVIFTASAQHAAVNFPQRTLMSFAPAVTGAFWAETPSDIHSEEEWGKALPPLKQSLQQLSVLEVLGGVYYRQLGEYKTNEFPYLNWFEDPDITKDGGPLDQFRQALSDIEEEINIRNQNREGYSYLLPSKIPVSINI
ncbi:Arachidonate 15-lipoxygenase precursor [Photobacterium marinum]|uniref:Arachidonate 15-lipoxygenase n=1 Tax=Photobacterium marinum TaxID=1056511 RepID=L8JBT8_9GAMM|nr:lipoxygenase family protein [Photobacterium marinum]ELR66266.1 Arachidonate 15-lipoxygenase precursor [Photobacterium marinum]